MSVEVPEDEVQQGVRSSSEVNSCGALVQAVDALCACYLEEALDDSPVEEALTALCAGRLCAGGTCANGANGGDGGLIVNARRSHIEGRHRCRHCNTCCQCGHNRIPEAPGGKVLQ